MNSIKLVLLTSCLLLSKFAFAHDASVATFNVRHVGQKQWIFEAMTPLFNLDKSLRATNKKVPKADLKDVTYKQAVIGYIKQEFNIEACRSQIPSNDKLNRMVESKSGKQQCNVLDLGKGKIQLSNHSSTFIFEIKGMPEHVGSLSFRVANMSENKGQTNIFRLIDGDKTERFVLTQKNNFSGKDSGFFQTTNKFVHHAPSD